MKSLPLIIAHRGASRLVGQDNTITSFQRAIELGVDMIEFDIRKTRDGRIVCFHDASIYGIPVSELTYTQLNEVSPVKVPTLYDVIELCKDKICLDVEIKEGGFEKEVVSALTHSLSLSSFVIKSFDDAIVKEIYTIHREITTGLLIREKNDAITTTDSLQAIADRIRNCYADFISPHKSWMIDEYFNFLPLANIPIYCWTVNDPSEILHLTKQRIHAIITDCPDIAQDIFQRITDSKC